MRAPRPTKSQGAVRFLVSIPQSRLSASQPPLHKGAFGAGKRKGCGASQGQESAPVLSGIQNVITDGNPAKWVGGVSKNRWGQRGFVKITRGKSDGLIRF